MTNYGKGKRGYLRERLVDAIPFAFNFYLYMILQTQVELKLI